MGYRLWRDTEISELRLQNVTLFERCCDEGLSDAAADVARVEILLREGGVYVDADSICHRSLDEAGFMDAGFFAAVEPSTLADDLISNAFMGAVPGHPVLRRYAEALSTVDDPRPQWQRTGPLQLTGAIRGGDEPDLVVLPAWTFLVRTAAGEPVGGGDPYGEHFFSSTAERSDRWIGARRYPDGKSA
jgi:mannosyltransferase OCH1-like enzyme